MAFLGKVMANGVGRGNWIMDYDKELMRVGIFV
jgi:hypothetical protein